MKLLDIIALAKAGYKKSDIDDLLKIPTDEPEPDEEDPESTGPEADPEDETGAESPEETDDDPVDYKQLYDDLIKDHETLKKELKKAQKNNLKQDNSKNEKPSDLDDIFRAYM